ncbi:MAG: cupredoxin domain-containing protein [Sulfuriferula sp.]
MKPFVQLVSVLALSVVCFSAMAADMAVTISQFAFTPPAIEVPVGTKVIWTNQDQAKHSIISDTGVFGSSPLKQGDNFSYTFTGPGTYAYHCGYHSYMTGVITVK